MLRDQHGYQAVNLLYRQGRMTTRVTFNLSCFGPDAVIGVECVKRHTFNAISRLGDDMLRLSGIGEDVLQVGPDGVYPEEDYHEILVHLAKNDWKFQHHATAESTQHSMVDMWEEVNETEAQMDDLGWVMLHPGEGPEDPSQEVLDQLASLGAGIVPTNPGGRGGGTSHPPYRRIYSSDAESCLGTDALNASTYSPFVSLWYVHSGKTYVPGQAGVVPEQRLTRTEALEMATKKCGWFMELEDKVGTLEVGKYADLIVTQQGLLQGPRRRHPLAHVRAHGRGRQGRLRRRRVREPGLDRRQAGGSPGPGRRGSRPGPTFSYPSAVAAVEHRCPGCGSPPTITVGAPYVGVVGFLWWKKPFEDSFTAAPRATSTRCTSAARRRPSSRTTASRPGSRRAPAGKLPPVRRGSRASAAGARPRTRCARRSGSPGGRRPRSRARAAALP